MASVLGSGVAWALSDEIVGRRVAATGVGWVTAFVVGALLAAAAFALADHDGRQVRPLLAALGLATTGFAVQVRLSPSRAPSVAAAFVAAAVLIWAVSRGRFLRSLLSRSGGRACGVLGTLLVCSPLLPWLGISHGGARAYVQLEGVEVIPGELGRVLLLVGMCVAVSHHHAQLVAGRRMSFGRVSVWLPAGQPVVATTFLVGAAVLVAGITNMFGPTALLVLSAVAVLTVGTGRLAYPFLSGVLALVVSGLLFEVSGNVSVRVRDWLRPFGPSATGGPVPQALIGARHGGIFGVGLGHGMTRTLVLPSSDYVTAVVATELGAIGVAFVLSCVVALAAKPRDAAAPPGVDAMTSRLVTTALTVGLCGQALLAVGGVLDVFPIDGITLPFVGAGDSSLVAAAFGVAVLYGLGTVVPSRSRVLPRRTLPGGPGTSRRAGVVFAGLTVVAAVVCCQDVAIAGGADETPPPSVVDQLRLRVAQLEVPTLLDREGRVLAATTRSLRNGDLEGDTRTYPTGALFSDPVGFRAYDGAIDGPVAGAGVDGWLRAPGWFAGAPGQPHGLAGCERTQAAWLDLSGCPSVLTTLDTVDQQTAVSDLDGTKGSSAVAVDVATGGVLAEADSTSFDPNGLSAYSGAAVAARADLGDSATPTSRATTFSPGSSIKTLIAMAAMRAGVAVDGAPVEESWAPAGGSLISNDSRCGGPIVSSLAVSCSTTFARLAVAVGPAGISGTAHAVGLLANTFGGLPAAPALLPGPAAPPAVVEAEGIGETTTQVSTVGMAELATTIANGGRTVPPTYVLGVCHGSVLDAAPRDASSTQVVGPADNAELVTAMRAVVAYGTLAGTAAGRRLAALGAAAKTGTAALGEVNGVPQDRAWLIAFAPADHPKVAVAVTVGPTAATPGPVGATAAGPIAADLLRVALARVSEPAVCPRPTGVPAGSMAG